jgi:polyhydroxybutyrate depolymerase
MQPGNIWRKSLCGVLILAGGVVLSGCGDPGKDAEAMLGVYSYPENAPRACAPGEKQGKAGVTAEQKFSSIKVGVRTPKNYDPTFAHPLLIVFPAAGADRFETEAFTELTREATQAGFIIAYPDHLPMEQVITFGDLPAVLAENWCIDKKRMFFTGHSDGGNVSTALAVAFDSTRGLASAIAPSAAGFDAKAFSLYRCPDPLPVMVMHHAHDMLFPGWGRQAAKWWAECNRCDRKAEPERREKGCVAYRGCAAETLYCEGESGAIVKYTGLGHLQWPGLNQEIIDFFRHAPGQ